MNYDKFIQCILLFVILVFSFCSCKNQNEKTNRSSTSQISSSIKKIEITPNNSINDDTVSNNLDFNEIDLIGIWQIEDVHMAAGFSDTLRFSENGEFFYVPSTMTIDNRLIASKGNWKFDNKTNQVMLLYNQQLVIEGGVFQPEDDLDYEAYKGGKPVFKDYSKEELYSVGMETVDIGDVYTLINEHKYYYVDYVEQDSEELKYFQDLFSGKIKIYENK